MKKRAYNKKPLSFADQLQQLKDRNLTVTDNASALHYLSQIGYYRLSAYFLPYQNVKDRFDDGITFGQIIDTYAFDRELRLLVFDCIERIEVAIRTQFIYCVVVSDFDELPEGMEPFVLPGGLYAVFHYKGLNTDHTIFQYIIETWLPDSMYRLDNRPHFEVLGDSYKNNDPASEEDIWIPIKPNNRGFNTIKKQ